MAKKNANDNMQLPEQQNQRSLIVSQFFYLQAFFLVFCVILGGEILLVSEKNEGESH